MNKITDLINKNDWQQITSCYDPKLLAESLSLKQGMAFAYRMLFNKEMDDDLRDFATIFLDNLRQVHNKEWSQDWRNDVFLGDACHLTMKYDERYESYKRAYEKANPIPSSLLISLAGCYLSPGKAPITIQEAEKLIKMALEKGFSIEAVILMRGICAEKKDQSQFHYWDKILKEIEQKNIHVQLAWPGFQ